MIGDPQRLQYLEAMGIPAWVSRYRFVNARPTEQGDWQLPARSEKAAPGQRLQALLETPVEAGGRAPAEPRREGPAPAARARALLDGDGESPGAAESTRPTRAPSSEPNEVAAPEPAATTAPLRFTLSLAVLEERWWLLLPGEQALSASARKLLRQLLCAAGLPSKWSPLATLSWPLIETPVSDPAGEAREGIQVFCAGQALRNQLSIDGALVIGDSEPWTSLLTEDADAFDFPCHHWPHPEALLVSAKAKRECWPLLHACGRAWRERATATATSL